MKKPLLGVLIILFFSGLFFPTRITSQNDDYFESIVNPGQYTVQTFKYASAYNPRRKDYAPDKIDIKSAGIDIFDLAKIDSKYWGFDSKNVPLNGYIWKPQEKGKFPIIFCVHGNHDPKEFSEPGYAYLGEYFASRGFIFVSVDENFLNGLNGENDARGYVLLKNIEFVYGLGKNPESQFFDQIREEIYIIGHSRGGEAVIHASVFNRLEVCPDNGNIKFNFHFPIKGIVCLAPVSDQYLPSNKFYMNPDDNILILQGSHDGDVHFEAGWRFFYYPEQEKGSYRFYTWIRGANHAQFNSVWAEKQDPSPALRKDLISFPDQKRIAATYIFHFLNFIHYVTLHKDRGDPDSGFENNGMGNDLTSGQQEDGTDIEYANAMKSFEFLKNSLYGKKGLVETRLISNYKDGYETPVYSGENDIDLFTADYPQWKIKVNNLKNWGERVVYFESYKNKYYNQMNWCLEIESKENSSIEFYAENPENSVFINYRVVFDMVNLSNTVPEFDIIITDKGGIQNIYKSEDFFIIRSIPIINTFFQSKTSRTIFESFIIPLEIKQVISIAFHFRNSIHLMLDRIRFK